MTKTLVHAQFEQIFINGLPPNAAMARHQLWQVLNAPERRGWERLTTSGRFDARRAAYAQTGNVALFKRRADTKGIETAVSILIDGSGSMQGRNSACAAQVAYMIADACEKARAKCEVLAFKNGRPSDVGGVSVRGDNAGRPLRPNMSAETCRLLLIKDVSERNANMPAAWVAAATKMAGGGTPDYAGIRAATERLVVIPANRKLLFTITDGSGNGEEFVRHAVSFAEDMDITVVGVGIGHDVKAQYKISGTVNNPTDLAGVALPSIIKGLKSARLI